MNDLRVFGATLTVGQRVGVDHDKYPGVWIVSKLAPVNVTLTPEGGGRGLKAPRSLIIAPDTARVAVTRGPVTYFTAGQFVRIPAGKFAGLYIVKDDRGGDTVSVVRPGGDDGRYVRANRNGLTLVDADKVREVLALLD